MMSAAQEQQSYVDAMIPGGVVTQPSIRPGQKDPRAIHYAYSAGERELKTRARDTGYSSILPGYLVPLTGFKIRISNDTAEALLDPEAPKEVEHEVKPYDIADTLMSRYQHRGLRILTPLTGMEGDAGKRRAARLFSVVHPPITCPRNPKTLSRQCVYCRLEDLRSDAWMDRVVEANLSDVQDIPYGLQDDGQTLRFLSENEAVEIMHELILSANEELYNHMIDVLVTSKADVQAGQKGPGKKAYDKRDDWYFMNTHKLPEELQVVEMAQVQGQAMGQQMAMNMSQFVAETFRASQQPSFDVQAMLAEQEKRHQQALREQEEKLLKMFRAEMKKKGNQSE